MSETDRDDLALERLRELAHSGAPPRHRRSWLRVAFFGLFAAIISFAAISPTRVPAKLVSLFTDRPVTEVSMRGGSFLEIRIDDPDKTEEVAGVFRSRGADVAFSAAGTLILEVPGRYREGAREWARRITSSGKFEMALVEDERKGGEPASGTGRWITGDGRAYRLGETQFAATDIVSAAVLVNPTTTMPEVHVRLTPAGGKLLEVVTRHNVGKKLAIVVGGELISAPVIAAEIRGGAVAISVAEAGDSTDVATARAESLAAVLGGEPLSADVEISNHKSVYPLEATGAVWAGRGVFALLVGLLGVAIALPFRRRLQLPEPEVSPLRGVKASRKKLAIGALLSVAAVALGVLLSQLPIPRNHASELQLFGWSHLGVAPLLAGIVAAYLLGRVVPALRPLFVPLAIVGSLGSLALMLRSVAIEMDWMARTWPVADTDITLAIIGATSVGLWLVSRAIERWGVGNGYLIALAGGLLATLYAGVEGAGYSSGLGLAAYVLGGLAIAAVTAFLLRTVRRSRDGLPIRLIGAGAAAVAAVGVLEMLIGPLLNWIELYWAVAIAITSALVIAIVRPARGAGPRVISEPTGPRWPLIAAVSFTSLAYTAGLMLFDLELPGLVETPMLSAASVALLTAGLLDVVGDLRARWRNPELVRVAELHDPRVADATAAALVSAGIDAHLANANTRWLLGPLGAWARVGIWVPEHRRDDAAAIIDGQT